MVLLTKSQSCWVVVPASTYCELVRVWFSVVINWTQKICPLFQADAQYKALECKQIPRQQIQKVNSTHRTSLKGVYLDPSVSKRCKLCVTGRPDCRKDLHLLTIIRSTYNTCTIYSTTSLTSRRHLTESGMQACRRSSEASTQVKDQLKPFRHCMRTPAMQSS